MDEQQMTMGQWFEKNYNEHRVYIIKQRDEETNSSGERREWQKLLMDLDAAHDRLAEGPYSA